MPSSYTAKLYDGKDQTFAEFIMRCARGMGALITMRDEPLDAPIPEEFEPSTYHTEQLEQAKAELECVREWTDEQAKTATEESYSQAMREHRKAERERKALRKRYQDMLDKVRAWKPPTAEHQGLKEFMVEQLEQAIRFDCDYTSDPPQKVDGTTYKQQRIDRLNHDIAYHTEQHAKEVERAKQRSEWVKTLRDSLDITVNATS